MTPVGLARQFGPGLILMMTGIGTSHLVTAPVAGGRFEFALLWVIPVAYIFKYYGFEMAFRFTNATGRSMLDAYSTAWHKWPVWYVLITTILQAALGQAGRLTAAAAVAYFLSLYYFGVDVEAYIFALVIGVLSVVLILSGRYGLVELVTKVCAGILLLSTVAVFLRSPAPLSGMAHFFIFETPEGSWLILAAFLGLLPTGMDVSLQASEWGKAKKAGMGRIRDHLEQRGLVETFDPFSSSKEDLSVDTSKLPPHALEYCQRWFRIGLWDFRVGHIISFVIATIFLALAAVWIYPSEVEGRAVIGQIAQIFTKSVGPWMMIVFLTGAFAATFSTAFNYFDGWPRVLGDETGFMDRRNEVAERWAIWREEKKRREADTSDVGLGSAAIFAALNRHVPQNAIIAVDVGNNTYSFGRYFECQNQAVLMSGYLGSIGFALPAAIGAWAATKEDGSLFHGRPVMSISGDGGFGQYMAELTTAVKYDMNITHVLLNNNELGKISKEQRAGEWKVWETSLVNPNFAEYAKLCGAKGIRVESPDVLDRALQDALTHEGPALVEIVTDALLI